ncbi:MAG: CD1871A family CXXC motif-containing protein [Candidatus Ornithomonoglobus sp.]
MNNKRLRLIQLGIICLSAAFIAAGIYRGECAEVLKKAINICLSCIGIG